MEFMQRLAALVPRPRLHLIRFHGVLAPNAKLRKAVVPVPPPPETKPAHADDCAHLAAGSAKGRMRWAQLLKRVFDIDIEHCPHCGGQLKLIAAIEEPAAIARIHASGAGRPAATACTGGAGGSVSGSVRNESGLVFGRAGGGVRTAFGQSLRWRGIQAR